MKLKEIRWNRCNVFDMRNLEMNLANGSDFHTCHD